MPTPAEKRAAYAKELKKIASRYVTADDKMLRAIVAELQALRKEMAGLLLSSEGLQLEKLNSLQNGAEDMIDAFSKRLTPGIGNLAGQMLNLGSDAVVDPLNRMGFNLTAQAPDLALVNATVGNTARLVQNISMVMRLEIDRQLQLSVLGGQTPTQAMKGITDILGVRATDGVWGRLRRPEIVKGVAARAEAIFRTENTRILNLAMDSQQQVVAQAIPEIRKRWLASGDDRTRPSHLQTHIDTAANPIPVDFLFSVGSDLLRFPGDPNGSAEETINCRCSMATVVQELGPIETSLDKAIEQEILRREDAKTN